jgi:hypothetical protein
MKLVKSPEVACSTTLSEPRPRGSVFRRAFFNSLLAALAAAALATAQDTNKLVVPLSNAAQPVTIKLSMISGTVTVTGGATQQVTVETSGGGDMLSRSRRNRNTTPPPGMHRIDTGGSSEVVEDHNVVTIKPGFAGRDEHLSIQVPVNTSVEIKAVTCGTVEVSGVTGDMDVECTNGSLDLKGITGSVVAHTINGSITVAMDKVSADKAMSFTSLNGKVDVTLPSDTKARLRIKTTNGTVFTDFDVKMEADSKPIIEDGHSKGGKYRIRMDHGVYGSINGGGPEYLFQTMNGEILIHKK